MFCLTPEMLETTVAASVPSYLCMKHHLWHHALRIAIPLVAVLWFCPAPSFCQDTADQGTNSRGSRAEIAVTLRDRSGQIVLAPATVRLYQNGTPSDQSSTSRGRAFFIPRSLGEFSVTVEAVGYKPAQKDVSLAVPIQAEVDVYLERDASPGVATGVPGPPLLAPKAKEALDKGRQALREDKIEDAQKYLGEAIKLAPANPEVLYVQGILDMRLRNWTEAESVLGKSNQLEPNQPKVLAALGMTLCNQKKYEQAIPVLEKSLQLAPATDWETSWALAKAYYYHEQYEEALKLAQQAHTATKGSSNAQVELLLAQCLTAVGRYEDSAQVLRDFLKGNPSGPDASTARRWLDGLAANGKTSH